MLAGDLIQGTEGLVHEENGGAERQRPGDGHPLLHAAGQLPRVVAPETFESYQVEHLIGAFPPIGLRPSHELERQLNVLAHRAPVKEPGCLKRHAVVTVLPRLIGWLSVHADLPVAGMGEGGHQSQQSALAAPRRADQSHELVSTHRDADIIEGEYLVWLASVEDLGDRCCLDGRHGLGSAHSGSPSLTLADRTKRCVSTTSPKARMPSNAAPPTET